MTQSEVHQTFVGDQAPRARSVRGAYPEVFPGAFENPGPWAGAGAVGSQQSSGDSEPPPSQFHLSDQFVALIFSLSHCILVGVDGSGVP